MFIIVAFLIATPFCINYYVVSSVSEYLITEENSTDIGADCILVLGAGLNPDGTPSPMLEDRLDKGIELYKEGVAPKLLLSGDNGQDKYDEVNAMKKYALNEGIPPDDIFLDHAGFSTYESMYRARDIFQVEKMIVITQRYHQHRALYIANSLGIKSYGVVSEPRTYYGQNYREAREFLARNKDFFKTMLELKPTYLGVSIPITSSGLATHD